MESIKLEISEVDLNSNVESNINTGIVGKSTSLPDKVSNTTNNNSSDKLTNNNLMLIINIITIIQSRGKIPVGDMFETGNMYMRLRSYTDFISLSLVKREEIIASENESKIKYLKELDIKDLVFVFNFIDNHIKNNSFKEEEIELIRNLNKKIYNTLKPFIKTDSSISNKISTPLERINEEIED